MIQEPIGAIFMPFAETKDTSDLGGIAKFNALKADTETRLRSVAMSQIVNIFGPLGLFVK